MASNLTIVSTVLSRWQKHHHRFFPDMTCALLTDEQESVLMLNRGRDSRRASFPLAQVRVDEGRVWIYPGIADAVLAHEFLLAGVPAEDIVRGIPPVPLVTDPTAIPDIASLYTPGSSPASQDEPTDLPTTAHDAIIQVLDICQAQQAARFPKTTFFPLTDRLGGHYVLMSRSTESRHASHEVDVALVMHDGQIWVQKDATENGVVGLLLGRGIPAAQIVPGYLPPQQRVHVVAGSPLVPSLLVPVDSPGLQPPPVHGAGSNLGMVIGYRAIIDSIFRFHERWGLNGAVSTPDNWVYGVRDTTRDCYALIDYRWMLGEPGSGMWMFVQLVAGQYIIQIDHSKRSLALELLEEGVPRSDIWWDRLDGDMTCFADVPLLP